MRRRGTGFIRKKGLIAVGADADFAILNPDKEWIIRKRRFKADDKVDAV